MSGCSPTADVCVSTTFPDQGFGGSFGAISSVIGPVSSDFYVEMPSIPRYDPQAPLRVIAHVRARSKTHRNVAVPHNPIVMIFGGLLQLFGAMPTPESIRRDLNIPERFTYQYTKFDQEGEVTTLRYQDPNSSRNSVRISIKDGKMFARLIKGDNHYDAAGTKLATKEGPGIPVEQFRVPDGFFP